MRIKDISEEKRCSKNNKKKFKLSLEAKVEKKALEIRKRFSEGLEKLHQMVKGNN